MKNKRTILITGGAGYIGTVLVERLLAETDFDLIVYDNLMYDQEGLFALMINPRVSFVYGDVRDFDKLQKYLDISDYVVPLAAIVGMPACAKNPRDADDINYRQLYYIAENTAYDTKILVPNSNSGYGATKDGQSCTEKSPLQPISVYGQTKCKGEKAVMDSGKGVGLRLATVFGTSYRFRKDLLVNDFVLKAITDKYIVLFESHFKRNYIHIRDVVNAMVMILKDWDTYKGEIYNVGLSSANLSKWELGKLIKKFVPDLVLKKDNYTEDADKRNYIVSNAKLEATGWKAKYSLEDGILELMKAYPILLNTNTKFTNL